MTQELLALVTGLAHYLKILIRIALTGALKLERDYATREAISSFLDKLHLLAVQGANPAARRIIRGSNGEPLQPTPGHGNYGTQCVTYGFRSLAPENAGESPFSPSAHRSTENGEGNGAVISASKPPSDLCAKCGTTVEEDCVRLGTYQRWHSHCIACVTCGKSAAVPIPKDSKEVATTSKSGDERDAKDLSQGSKPSTQRRPPANVGQFGYDPASLQSTPSFGDVPTRIYCLDHAHKGCKGGFQPVQRLEQYAFLLNVALRRLYLLLRKQGVVPAIIPSPPPPDSSSGSQAVRVPADMSDPYRNSSERMKSVYLDRKLSATARVPKRSTIVEGPSSNAVTIGSTSYAQASSSTASSPPTQYYAPSSSSYPQSSTTSQTSTSQYQQPQRPDINTQHIPPPSPKQAQPVSTPGPAPYRPQQAGQGIPRAGPNMLEPLERSALPYASEENPANIPVPSSPSTASGHHGGNAAYYDDTPGQYQQQAPYPQSQQLYQPQPQHYQNQQYAPQQQYQYSQQQQYHQQQQQQASSSAYPIHGAANTQRAPGSSAAGSDGLTLADIPSIMEAAQAREQHRSLPREGSIPYISELSPLELAIIRHCAVLALIKGPLKDSFDLDEILEMVEAKKSTFWNKLFNKGEKAKNVKKKGVFGVPLELLVERDGADSMLGAARVTIRVPSFIDDVISAMRTMGWFMLPRCLT